MQRHYPELRVPVRNRAIILKSATAWIVYLTGYEFLFRGAVLFYGITHFGMWNGVSLMTVIYVLVHLDKPSSETFICFLAGPLFAFVTLYFSSIWSMVILHSTIVIATENLAARYNPRFSKR